MIVGIEKHLDRIVETLALSALMQANPSKKIEKRLREIAFPLEIELEEVPEGTYPKELFEWFVIDVNAL